MATKIRLQRFGKKGKPFYHVVVADSRAPRDGKFIERIGSYNPNTNPATIILNFDKALDWVNKGAEPTDTCRAILSYRGVLYKKHLQGGVRKGALTEDQVETKFAEWLSSKETRIEGKKENLVKSKSENKKAALAAESARKEAKAASIVAKNTPPADEVEETQEEVVVADEASAEVETPVEETAEETTEEAPVAEETAEEAPVAEEVVETPVAEVAEEAPVAEEASEEAPAAEEVSEEATEAPAEEENKEEKGE